MKKTDSTPTDLANLVFSKLNNSTIHYPCPPENVLINLFQCLFFTSIKTEEGQFIKVTVTLIDPINPDPNPPKNIVPDRWKCIHFDNPIPFTVKNLVKLSKAADPWSSSLAVYYDTNNELVIWGLIDQAVHYQSYLNYETTSGPEQPGLFQAIISGIGNIVVMFDYELLANLKQNTLTSNYIDVFNSGPIQNILSGNAREQRKIISDLVDKEYPTEKDMFWQEDIDDSIQETLSRILIKIQNYNHGGAFLIAKTTDDLNIKYKLSYGRLSTALVNMTKLVVSNVFYSNKIGMEYLDGEKNDMPIDLYLDESVSDHEIEDTRNELKGAIRFISSLSCVDGLIVFSPELEVKGFGAVIHVKDLPPFVYISQTPHIVSEKLIEQSPDHFGTRHRSMFSYCWNNLGSLGFVVSQDGEIRAITRVSDKLIMWENIKVQQFSKSRNLKRKKT